MQIKVTLGDNDRLAIVLPADYAGQFAELLSRATIFEREGYYAHSGWKEAEKGVQLQFVDGTEFAPVDTKLAAAQKQYEDSNSERWAEHSKRQAAEKERDQLRAALDAVKAAGSCRMPPAPEFSEVVGADEEAIPL